MSKVFSLIFISTCHFCFGQSKHPLLVADTSNLYYKTLVNHLEFEKCSSHMQATETKKYDINVEEKYKITDNLPLTINEYSVHYLTETDLINKTKKDDQLFLFVITPMKNEKDTIEVGIIDYYVSQPRRKHFEYGNGGSGIYKYKFNCILNCFELIYNFEGGR